MKRILMASAIALSLIPTMSAATITQDDVKSCLAIQAFDDAVVSVRDLGMSKTNYIALMKGSPEWAATTPLVRKLVSSLVIQVYSRPAGSPKSMEPPVFANCINILSK